MAALAAPPRDFAATLTLLRAGHEPTWAVVYRQLAPRILGYLRGLGALDPEDLLGEVFVQVVRDVARFEGDERAFRAWTFTVAHHRFLDDRRKARRRKVEPVAEVPERASRADAAPEAAFGGIERARVLAVLDGLSRDQRAVLLLRVLGDLTSEQVAQALGKRRGAVKALQRRALASVRREIEAGRTPICQSDAWLRRASTYAPKRA